MMIDDYDIYDYDDFWTKLFGDPNLGQIILGVFVIF